MRALVLCFLAVAVLGGLPLASAQSTPADATPQTDLIVQLEADGDAQWIVETRLPLNDTNETQGFRDLGARYVDGEPQITYAPGTFDRIATQVSEETGRPMEVRNRNRSWRIEENTPAQTGTPGQNAPNKTGVLRFSFTWTNFARTSENEVVVGDAFQTEDRWLPRLRAGQTLVLRAPENYSITSASVGHTRTTVRWEGPTAFEDDALRATFTGTDNSPTPPNGPAVSDLPISLDGVLAILAALLLAVVAYGVTRRSSPSGDPATSEPATAESTGGAPTTEQDPEPAGTPTDPFEGVDEDLLSDEERIERHLEAAGGRMKQAEIVERTGWSNAKVSQVLSGMDEEGRVEKLRIGRENLISLPEEDE
jgi:uncharacterized membrane protein